jgi:GxxExxY protein
MDSNVNDKASKIIYKEESYNIISVCLDVYNELGNGFLEIVYKDAIEKEFIERKIPYVREKLFTPFFKGKPLSRKFSVDFEVFGKIILEVKAASELMQKFKIQTFNYLKTTKYKLGILVNFGEESLKYKRLVF